MTHGSATASRRSRLLLAASRHPLAARLADGLSECGEVATGRLALLVSGGGDSMALLLLAAAVRERQDQALASLAVLTIDHGLRPEAREECGSVLALAGELGIERASCRRVDVPRAGNLLEQARIARYAAARAFVEEHSCSAAVVAHTADDRAEGLLLSLRRGHGISALTRLLPTRAFAEPGMPTIVRPLLGVRRAALRAFLAEVGVPWHEDPSNRDHDRGGLRTDPSLAALVDAIAAGSARLVDEAAELLEFREHEIASRIGRGATAVGRSEFDRLPAALQAAALRSIVHAAGGEIPHRTLERAVLALRDRAPRRFACTDGVELSIDAREVGVRRAE